jgi:GTP-binding protein EngB required for normal cell division
MRDPVHGLRDDLARMRKLLSRGTFLSFSPEEKQGLLTDSQRLLQRLDTLSDSSLTVGLIGGTGVGKSTLMNALAGAEISSTSHRRPHTDQVLIYHHEAVELPEALRATKVPRREYPHALEAIRQILLCDLPDFDSLMGEHRERVLRFLEHLDVLVWVTSLEKYADRKFYEFLRMAPKAELNYYFVLNKMDKLFDNRSLEAGYDDLGKVTAGFRQHLTEAGISNPLIYPLSALQAFEQQSPEPWSQFPSFRHQIFQQRDIKEITAIKAANLDVEVQHVVSSLQRESINLETMHNALEDAVEQMKSERQDWVDVGKRSIDVWVERTLKEEVLSEMVDASPLVGPGHGIALLIQEWQRWRHDRKGSATAPAHFTPPEQTVASLRRQLERLEDRIVIHFMRLGLPSPFIAQLQSLFEVKQEWEDLVEKWRQYLEVRLATDAGPSFGRFIGFQFVLYFILFMVFMLAIAGEPAWRQLIEDPEWSSIAYMIVAAIYTLFSPVGLAALCTYAILNIALAFRFNRRYKKLLQNRAHKFVESVKAEVERIWEEELDRTIARMEEYDMRLQEQLADITALRRPFKEE